MESSDIVMGVVALLLGGGGVGALVPLFRARADNDSTIAVGSEAAVQSLTTALDRSDRRVAQLEAENAKLRAEIADLRSDVVSAQANVNTLTLDLAETKAKLDKLLNKN